ncbi:MAG: hypothetical protein ACON4O_07070 [Lentimonas sp.]
MKAPKRPLRKVTRAFLFGLTVSLFSAQAVQAAKDGAATLKVMPWSNKVQQSNYGKNSFQLTNSGSKNIVEFRLDVTRALFPDIVFDPEGVAGDSVAKALQINKNEATGLIPVETAARKPYLGEGGVKGYWGLLLTFDSAIDDGFNPGETLGFSIDMDPNSIAGTKKWPIDQDSYPEWDCGGVSGAEMIGSVFTVTFEDGSHASGQLFTTVNQAGSQGLAIQETRDATVQVSANGKQAGEVGTYTESGLELFVKGEKGHQVRVVLAKGFIQPAAAYEHFLQKQLEALLNEDFPANNAVELQFATLKMTGEALDISNRFNLKNLKHYAFKADPEKPFSMDDDKLHLAITAAVIDENGMPLGPVSEPIYLTYE